MNNKNEPETTKPKVTEAVEKSQATPETPAAEKSLSEPTPAVDQSPETNQDSELESLKKQVAKLENDKLLLAAELKNAQNNFQRQMEQVYKYSNKRLVSWVLAFLVDLEEKALSAMRADPESKVKNHLIGIEMLRNILWKNLENEGVKQIPVTVGKDKWSSHLYELVEEVENEQLPPGTVVEVVAKGYLLADQVLRPVKVKISKSQTSLAEVKTESQ